MGLYTERLLPHLVDRVCGQRPYAELRQRVCAGLAGEVVEVGFGSGLNVPHYPEAVTGVAAVEPSEVAWRLARDRVAASPVAIIRAGLDGQSLPFADNTFDCALSTWTMCTIPDLPTALAELRRVLRPDGRLHFVEHGLAPDPRIARWQHRLDPIQKRMAGGCHLSRPIAQHIRAAGFSIETLDEFYDRNSPKVAGRFSLGTAVAT